MNALKYLILSSIFLVWACDRNDNQEEATQAPGDIEEEVLNDSDNEDLARREALSRPPAPIEIVNPEANPRRGRILFITNGCVICHQVNDVGGTAAPPLDAINEGAPINPLEFSARMWRGASAMTALQSIELGYVIQLDGQDISDLAAFAGSKDEQSLLTLESVPEGMRDWFLNTPYWQLEEWDDYLKRGERIPFEEQED